MELRFLLEPISNPTWIYVVAVDCRGTDGRGSNFRKQTYLNLGEKESYDFAATAQYLRTLPI
jgi:dipeptidyl-peptidase-4